jgi:hypothetical protein
MPSPHHQGLPAGHSDLASEGPAPLASDVGGQGGIHVGGHSVSPPDGPDATLPHPGTQGLLCAWPPPASVPRPGGPHARMPRRAQED